MYKYFKLVLKPTVKGITNLLFFVILSTNAQELSLKQAHQLMVTSNGDLKASHFEVQAVKEEAKVMKGLYYPSVNVSGSYLHLDQDITADLNSQRDLVGGLLQIQNPAAVLGDWQYTIQEQNFGFAAANINWPIFAGGKINAANEAAKIKSDISENLHHLKEDTFTINLIDYYFKLKLAKEAETLRNEVYKTIQLHNNHAEKLFNNGMIPEVETLNAKVALSNAKRELLAAQKDVSLANTAVQNLVGGVYFDSISTKFSTPIILPPLVEIQQEMLNKNKQLNQIAQNYELAQVGLKVENSEYYPKVALMGMQLLWKDNLPLIDTKWFAGVGLKWELFDGFQREHKIKASKYKISQVEEIEKQARLNILTYTEKLYSNIQKQQEQYESLNADEIFAEKLKYMRTRAFEEGTGTSLEVIDATLKLTEIKLYKLKALYQYNITYGELMVHLGQTKTFLNQN
tara:strand:+ start:11587 stop:12960 length:1374 start_codon:yes stop_codon:yes gene_type:complete